jgi:hypothetical protein
MAKQFTKLRVVVSSTVECVLMRLPTEAFRLDVVDDLVAEFWKQEEWRLHHEKSGVKVYDMILGPLSGRVRLANRLEEAIEQLWAKQAARREADFKLEALRCSTTWVRNVVLERVDGTSSLVASLSSMVELIEDRIDVTTTNRVH